MTKEQKIYCIIGKAVSILFGCSVVAGVILAILYYALFCQRGGKYMEAIICTIAGIFIGLTTSWYFQIKPMADKDKLIEEQKEENLQVCSENKELRAEIEDLKEDKRYLEKQINTIKDIVNDYDTADGKVAKIKEVITTANVK